MRTSSKRGAAACVGIVVLSLALAGAALAETTVQETVAVQATSPAIEAEIGSEEAPVAKQYESTAGNTVSVRSQVSSGQVVSSGVNHQRIQGLGRGISSRVEVATSQARSQQAVRTNRSNGNLAVGVQTTGGEAPTTVISETPTTSGTSDTSQDALRSSTHSVQIQPARTGQEMSGQTSDIQHPEPREQTGGRNPKP